MSTSKKEIIDFLWEWADSNDEWGKLLVEKVVTLESPLTPTERSVIFSYFLQSIRLHYGLPSLIHSKPTYFASRKAIELISLSDVSGVNRLAKNQTIDFSPNLTVIYGENATGKSGYGRILKILGFSYDEQNEIYSNIYEDSEPKSAEIKFKVNGKDEIFIWNGNNRNQELANISVFKGV